MACDIADGVTRRALKEGTPVVAFLIGRNTHFPYDRNPNHAPIYPCDLYVFQSLPIFGTYDGAGGLKLRKDDDSVAVKIALAQAGGQSWKNLMDCGVDDSYQLLGKPGDDNKRSYGLFIVHRDVFEMVCQAPPSETGSVASLLDQRDQDVTVVTELVNRYLHLCCDEEALRTDERGQQVYDGIQICSLSTSVGKRADGSRFELPELARVLESRRVFGRDFHDALDELKYLTSLPDRSPTPLTVDDIPQYVELLRALWMTQRFYRGLDLIDVTVAPSKRTRGNVYATKLEFALGYAENLVMEQLNRAREGYGDIDNLPELEALARPIRDLAGRLEHEAQEVCAFVKKEYDECMRDD